MCEHVNCNAFLVVANQLQELTTREHFGHVCEPARRHCDHNKVSLHVVLVTPASNYLMPLSHCSHCSIDNNTCVCVHMSLKSFILVSESLSVPSCSYYLSVPLK